MIDHFSPFRITTFGLSVFFLFFFILFETVYSTFSTLIKEYIITKELTRNKNRLQFYLATYILTENIFVHIT